MTKWIESPGPYRRDTMLRDAAVRAAVRDVYEPAWRIAPRLGLSVGAARQALKRARGRGQPIESRNNLGWRIARDRSIWQTWRAS